MGRWDVIVVGGGPGGSVTAARLAQLGRSVLLLEKERFPRFHLGESLLPRSLPTFETLGVLPELRERFLAKYGARFHDDVSGKKAHFEFRSAFDSPFDHAFEVPRDQFDELLLRHAGRLGAEVREGWSVLSVRFDGDRAVGVAARDADGAPCSLDARVVVDASGRSALLARRAGTAERLGELDQCAFYTHVTGVPRGEGRAEGDIDIVVSAAGWFWFIPFKDGRCSVGAVVPRRWVRERHGDESGASAMLEQAVAGSATASALLAGARWEWPARAAADFSYGVARRAGDGWLLVGDAGGFIDPLFSSGVHVAVHGGARAAEAIDRALAAGDVSADRFAAWAAETERGSDTFLRAVRAFYGGGLLRYLFAENKHEFLRRSISSLLSGDVFGEDVRWLNDVRARLADMTSPGYAPGST